MKVKLLSTLILFLLLFVFTSKVHALPLPGVTTTSGLGDNCTYNECSNPNLTCTKTGETKLIKCYHLYWGLAGINVTKIEDYGEMPCVDPQTGTYKQLNEACNDGTHNGECKFARKMQTKAIGEPDETGEMKDIKTCLDNSTPVTVTPPPSDQISKAKQVKSCYVDPAGGPISNSYHIILKDADELARWVFLRTDNNDSIYELRYSKKVDSKISASANFKEAGNYSVTAYGYDNKGKLKEYCTTPNYTFTDTAPPSGYQCQASVPPPKNGSTYELNEKITINVTGPLILKSPGSNGKDVVYQVSAQPLWDSKDFKTDSIGTLSIPIKVQGSPKIIVFKDGQQICDPIDLTSQNGTGGGGSFDSDWNLPPPSCTASGNTYTCNTAFGDIQTDAGSFVSKIFGVILSISGGIALLLIIISGYRLMISGGNPEKVQGAREQLTSAIIGLIFIIFSVGILQIIGVNVLHIPGFNP